MTLPRTLLPGLAGIVSFVASLGGSIRQLLIAANLNQQTLRGGAPTAFAGLLTKQQRDEFLA